MSQKFLTALDLVKNELQNAVIQNLAAAPSSPVKGQLYFDSTGNVLYWWNGTAWVAAQGGASVSYGSVPAETTFGIAKNDGVATTVARSDHTHGSPTHDAAAHSTIPVSAFATATGVVNMGGFKINNVGPPLAAGDAVNLATLQSTQAGLTWKSAVKAASTANVTMSGGQTLDGIACVAGDRVLLKNQTTASQNGIYDINAGAWTRAADNNIDTEMAGAAVFVMQGTTNQDTAWVCSTDLPITIDTTSITWVQFAGGGTVTAGAGMTQSGNTLNVIAGDTSLTVAADDVRVNTAVIATVASLASYTKKFVDATVGGATSKVVTHNLNTVNVLVDVFRTASPFDTVGCDVERTSANTVTLRFTVAPATNEYTCVVVG